jgi:methionyl-tRNA synthetase
MKYYLTTTLPYVNAAPHIGFALEIVQADALARWRRAKGDEVVFNTGTDEHGLKIYRKALEEGKDPSDYVAEYAAKFDELKSVLSLSYTHFIRTHTPRHMVAAQEFWGRCAERGDIYKKSYLVRYCVGCELEKTDSELEDGRCPLHPAMMLETIEEENYFFRFSKYQEPLLALYRTHPDFVVPSTRLQEIVSFVERGLTDFSVSRLASKMPWGVPVPGDESQVMYVWFDALVNYISTLGWPGDMRGFWPGTQVAGKDNLRQQSAMWQAMLMSAGLPPSQQIFIHGYLTSEGQKMSKSLGNVVDPFALVREFGTDAVRYYLFRELPPYEDGDFSRARFIEAYNGSLANGLGNLVSRVVKMAATSGATAADTPSAETRAAWLSYDAAFAAFNFKQAADIVWAAIAATDRRIQITEPFKRVKTDPIEARRDIAVLLADLKEIAVRLAPLLPDASERILAAVTSPSQEFQPLFPRLGV